MIKLLITILLLGLIALGFIVNPQASWNAIKQTGLLSVDICKAFIHRTPLIAGSLLEIIQSTNTTNTTQK